MKRLVTISLIMLVIIAGFPAILNSQVSPRSRESFNENWKFIKYFNASNEAATPDREPEGLQAPSFNDNSWRTLDLPHDWAIEGPFSDTLENNTGLLPWKGIGWYRKHFTVSPADKDKRIYIDFDGAMAYSDVWLNGIFAGGWPYGYTSFRLDLTPYVKYGQDNIIAVRLNTRKWDSRWYPGAGIYRNVWLVKTAPVHISYNGVFCTTPEIKKENGIVSISAEVESHLDAPIPVKIKAEVYKLNGKAGISSSPVAEFVSPIALIPAMDDHIFKSEDVTRPVTSGCNWDESGTNGFQKTLDVFGINYRLYRYDAFFVLKDNANLPFHSSESASTISSRGEYFFPVVQGDLNNNLPGKGIFQISSYDLAYPGWATTPDQQWEMQDKYPGVFGEFVWTGFDYIGEPTPYGGDLTGLRPGTRAYDRAKELLDKQNVTEVPSRSSYFGILDLAGFKKDRFWLYQSKWKPEMPMAHILPHWNWPERKGLVTPVHVYISGDEAELFLNGKSLGKKNKGQYEYRLRWDDVVYQSGELKVIAYKNGQKWAEDVMKTTGKASQLAMLTDRSEITSDGKDLVFVTNKIEDKNNMLVPRTNNQINFSIAGPGRILATDNGDAASHESFQAKSKKAFNGMCLVIVAAEKGSTGSFKVIAESEGLQRNAVTINIK